MATYEKSIFINRPPQEVWDFFSNPANSSQWSTTEYAEWTSEGPPSEHGYKSTSGPFPWEFTTKLEAKENGTQLNASGTAEVGGFFKMAEGLVVKQLTKQVDANFEALKLVLETGQA